MCRPSTPPPPPPPPAAPMVLEQLAPKRAEAGESDREKKRKGLSRYKIPTTSGSASTSQTNQLGGIPKKTGTG